MYALLCVQCGADLPEIKKGESTCSHCGTLNILESKDNAVFHRVDGKVPVEIPQIIAVGLFLRTNGKKVKPYGAYEEWDSRIDHDDRELLIGKEHKEVVKKKVGFWFPKYVEEIESQIKTWCHLTFGKSGTVYINVPKSRIEKAKELGVEIEESLGVPAQVYVTSAI